MRDYQLIVEFLRDFRTASVQTVTDEVREAAAEYAKLCTAANERLRQCATLLQRGLRAEAVHLAESAPNLLDLVAALDLPDPEGWADLCQRADMPVPETLQMDRAAQLNDAYGQDQPLEHLYAQHRRLALANGPLVKRLEVMRQLASSDPAPFWESDIRDFEKARMKELRLSFASAVKEKKVDKIRALATELIESPWLDPVPQDLAAAAADVHERIQLAKATQQLTELTNRLRGAYGARSVNECIPLLQQISEVAALHNGAAVAPESAAEIRTVTDWVKAEQRIAAAKRAFDESCAALSAALQADAKDGQIEAAYGAVQAHGVEIPPELEARYRQTISRRARAVKWKYASMLGGVAALLAVGLFLYYWRTQLATAREWAVKIQQAVAQKDVVLAQQLVDEQERRAPGVSSNAAVGAAKKEFEVLKDQVAKDTANQRDRVRILENAIRSAMSVGPSAPPDEVVTAAASLEDALAQRAAKQSAPDKPGSPEAILVQRLKDLRDDLRRRATAWVLAQIDNGSRKADRVTVEPRAASLTTADAAIDEAARDLDAGRRYVQQGGDEARLAMEAADAKVTRLRDQARKAHAEFDARQALADASGSAAATKAALTQFATQFPNSPLAADFTRAAAATDLYDSVEKWNAMALGFAADPAPASEKAATARLDVIRGFVRDHPTTPVIATVMAYGDYLQQASEAMSAQNAWQVGMNDVLTAPLIADLEVLQRTDGVRYYVLGNPNLRKTSANDRVRFTFDTLDPTNLAKRKTVTIVPPLGLIAEKPNLAPHSAFVRTLVEQLKSVDPAKWETWGIDLIDRLLALEGIDPVVKGILLREALAVTSRIDHWAVGETYSRSLDDLVRQKLDTVVWCDPERPVSDAMIANLKAIFAKVPRGVEVRKILMAKRAELFRSLRTSISGSGMLLRDDDGKLQIVAPRGSLAGETAWAILVPDAGRASTPPATQPAAGQGTNAWASAVAAPAQFIVVGRKKAGAMVVEETAARALPQGTMVFFSTP